MEPLFSIHETRTAISDTVFAPELVSLEAVLGVAVGYYVSAVSAANDENFTHLVMWKVSLVLFYVNVPGF